jgi:uncharacterized protein (TIGR03663 family)
VSPAASDGTGQGQSRRGLGGLHLLLVLAVALGLRTYDLAARPMHADEANQAVKLGRMLEGGTYVFDPLDHHGPTLYYFGLLPAWARGERSLGALSETTVRLTPAVAGVLAVALLWLLLRPWGPWPAFTAALFLAVSPAAVYYSRYFIQETLLVTFTLAAVVSGLRWFRDGGAPWAGLAGVCFGLMLATKSSALLVAAAALLALGRLPGRGARSLWRDAGIAAGAALLVAAMFYSSFGNHPGGLHDALLTPAAMAARVAGGASGHEKPWWYYGSLFVFQRSGGYVWDQTLFVLLAALGGLIGLRRAGLPRFVAVYAVILALALSAVPYKTPWLVLGLVPALCALAVLALGRLRSWQATALATCVVLGLGWQTRQAVFLRPADPRNPFAYAHSGPDMKKVKALAAAALPGPVKVISQEYWPLPWYLRDRPQTGYWTRPPADCDGPLVLVEADQADAVRACLRESYRESLLGLRPGILLVVFAQQPRSSS